jgi:hypothetical protein
MLPTALRGVLPITETIVLLVTALAVCAVLGWWKGGSAIFAIVWVVLCGWMLLVPLQGVQGYSALAQGWTLLLAAMFGMASLLTPNQSFLVRALSAIGISTMISFALAVVAPSGLNSIEGIMQSEYSRRMDSLIGDVQQATGTPQWQEISKKYPMIDSTIAENTVTLRAVPARSAPLLAALLALESLAALALGWALYHRLAKVPIGPTLGKLREFRFNDQLVWGLAVGATIVFLPPFADGRNVGMNLLLFFGTLYLLRGVGVLSWVSRGRGVATVLIIMTAIAPPLIAALALGVGVGDTWMDWRNRVPSPT